ncbi:hypothetical protein EHQ97_11410 [Leptospira adleri]|nr:hypothetical protein EHQ97_11410 [Leptospira adleri]
MKNIKCFECIEFDIGAFLLSSFWLSLKKKIKSFFLDTSKSGEFRSSVDYFYEEFSPISEPNLCFFAHYSSSGIVNDYVLYYLQKLRQLGFSIVLCTSTKILEEEKVKLKDKVVGILTQENYGWDFGLWKSGLLYLKDKIKNTPEIENILVANDSVYGPFTDLSEIFLEMKRNRFDLWAMSESFEVDRHIQSYFIVFNRQVIQSSFFWNFWEQAKYYFDKQAVIDNYELQLKDLFEKEGFSCGAFFSGEKIQKAVSGSAVNVNPTIKLWEPMIYSFHFPFIKGELLRKKMLSEKSMDRLKEFVAAKGYPVSYIERHLNSKR